MVEKNPFKELWIGFLNGFTPDMAIYGFLILIVVFLFAIKERIVFLAVANMFFLLIYLGIILLKWGF